jgi:transposase
MPEHLEVVEELLGPADKTCSHCGREQCLVREESSERLDLIPALLIRLRTFARCTPAAPAKIRARCG